MQEDKDRGTVNDHLANKRTYLSWIRTILGIMMSWLFVIEFAFFIKQSPALLGKGETIEIRGCSAFLGILIVRYGTITAIQSYIHYQRTEKQLKVGQYVHSFALITILTRLILSDGCFSESIPYSKYLI